LSRKIHIDESSLSKFLDLPGVPLIMNIEYAPLSDASTEVLLLSSGGSARKNQCLRRHSETWATPSFYYKELPDVPEISEEEMEFCASACFEVPYTPMPSTRRIIYFSTR